MASPSLQEASNKLQKAISEVKEAADAYVQEYGTGPRELLKLVQQNKSDWSGGTCNTINIVEAIIRRSALFALENIYWDKILK